MYAHMPDATYTGTNNFGSISIVTLCPPKAAIKSFIIRHLR